MALFVLYMILICIYIYYLYLKKTQLIISLKDHVTNSTLCLTSIIENLFENVFCFFFFLIKISSNKI